MILIADSGSTKTDWRLISEEGAIQQFTSEGLNPWYHPDESYEERFKACFNEIENDQIKEVHFYGSGVTPGLQTKRVSDILSTCFPNASVAANDDMLGAARALCDGQTGIAAILGTGSNICVCDGHEILERRPSMGYVLGDEGSGAYLGKLLLKAYVQGELSEELHSSFEARFNLTKEDILHKIYKEPLPNRFMAGFSKFIFQNKGEASADQLIIQCFWDFFEQQVTRIAANQTTPLHVTGSVGYYYGDYLRKVASEFNVNIGKVLEKPIAALTLYHLEK